MDVKQAVQLAISKTAEVFGATKIEDLSLEEVEHEDGFWNITVGFAREERPEVAGPFRAAVLPKLRREYKVVKIDERTGEVKSIKMRSNG